MLDSFGRITNGQNDQNDRKQSLWNIGFWIVLTRDCTYIESAIYFVLDIVLNLLTIWKKRLNIIFHPKQSEALDEIQSKTGSVRNIWLRSILGSQSEVKGNISMLITWKLIGNQSSLQQDKEMCYII